MKKASRAGWGSCHHQEPFESHSRKASIEWVRSLTKCDAALHQVWVVEGVLPPHTGLEVAQGGKGQVAAVLSLSLRLAHLMLQQKQSY